MLLLSIMIAALICTPTSTVYSLAAFALTLSSPNSHAMYSVLSYTVILLSFMDGNMIVVFFNLSLLFISRVGLATVRTPLLASGLSKVNKSASCLRRARPIELNIQSREDPPMG